MLELDFIPLDAPEVWRKTGAAASPEELVADLYPGDVVLRVSGVDLSPPGAPPFFGFVPQMADALAEQRDEFDVRLFVEGDNRIRIRPARPGEVSVSVTWSSDRAVVAARELRIAWAWFVRRIVGLLTSRDASAGDPPTTVQALDAAARIIAADDAPPLLRASDHLPETAAAALRRVQATCWSYGGFAGIGLNPIVVKLIPGDIVLTDGWDGERIDGVPLYRAIAPMSGDQQTYERVFRSAVADVLTSAGQTAALVARKMVSVA